MHYRMNNSNDYGHLRVRSNIVRLRGSQILSRVYIVQQRQTCETSLTCLAVPRVQGGVNNPVMRSVKSDTGDDCTATGVERVTPFSD